MISKKMKSGHVENINEFLLYRISTKQMLERKKTLYTSGVRDGDRLMLV